MAPSMSSSLARQAGGKNELPTGYTSIRRLLEGNVPVNQFVNVIGLVKDFRAPIPSKGADYKCTITIFDKSSEDENLELPIVIFRQEADMPDPKLGDVMVAFQVKVQSFRDQTSVITHRKTSIQVFDAHRIPKPPKSAKEALRRRSKLDEGKTLGDKEYDYVSWLYHNIDKYNLPGAEEFQILVNNSTHRREKFCKLENVVADKFYDTIVHVVKAPYDEADKTTIWVSDYTENDYFYNHQWQEPNETEGRDGDPYGYINTGIQSTGKWTGPYGKRSMQVTCFGEQGVFANQDVKLDQWIRIRNIRVKLDHNLRNLEGAVHEDRAYPGRRAIDILSTDDKDDCDEHLLDAIRRRHEYEKLKRKQLKKKLAPDDGAGPGTKRKADGQDAPKMNAKARRKAGRDAARKKVEEEEKMAEQRLGLSSLVKYESLEQPATPVSSITKPIPYKTSVDGKEVTLTLPFCCAKYRANVRVVDFRPKKLENFATWRKSTEIDLLSDTSSGESDTESEDEDHSTLDRFSGKKIWEWRFALQLEEAEPKERDGSERVWVVVDNKEGQQLTALDASNLRADQDNLSQLREQLFKLWGNLEEIKIQQQQVLLQHRKRMAAKLPPESSPPPYDENTNLVAGGDDQDSAISNKPFGCCIQQYGVRVRESDPKRADAGEGHRYQRMFGLFGTKICS
ncbi:hypothetical protein GGR57DRAFT_51832 [Xylariaceae sp. FL1272]|nr:hypothetical protein GGR57DRAFT_51832 [Xylariaceae sp. FL1272]